MLSWIHKSKEKHFIFQCLKCDKKIAISSEHHISRVHDLFVFCEKDLEQFVSSLRRGIKCYGYIDSWVKLKRKNLYHQRKIIQWAKQRKNIWSKPQTCTKGTFKKYVHSKFPSFDSPSPLVHPCSFSSTPPPLSPKVGSF